jgi:transcription elongation GreA/GreB family factor
MLLRQFWADPGLLNVTARQTLLPSGHAPISPVIQQQSLSRPARLRAAAQKNVALHAAAGCTVQLVSMQDELRCCFKLVTNPDPDISKGELSELSPLGQAMLGKGIGEQVKLKIPGVNVHFLITDILGDL